MKLKEGMFIKFKNKRGDGWTSSGSMDKYMGTIQEIERCGGTNFNIKDSFFIFNIKDIEYIIEESLGEI